MWCIFTVNVGFWFNMNVGAIISHWKGTLCTLMPSADEEMWPIHKQSTRNQQNSRPICHSLSEYHPPPKIIEHS